MSLLDYNYCFDIIDARFCKGNTKINFIQTSKLFSISKIATS